MLHGLKPYCLSIVLKYIIEIKYFLENSVIFFYNKIFNLKNLTFRLKRQEESKIKIIQSTISPENYLKKVHTYSQTLRIKAKNNSTSQSINAVSGFGKKIASDRKIFNISTDVQLMS